MSSTKRKYNKSDKELQLLVLQVMLLKKDILFGKFMGSSTTKTDIQAEWTKITNLAISYGLISADSDAEKFKRTTWQNWRRISLSKIDRMTKTGVGGATPKDLLDENDKVILAILGDEVAYGIGTVESHGDIQDMSQQSSSSEMPSTSGHQSVQIGAINPVQSSSTNNAKKRKLEDSSAQTEVEALKINLLKISYYQKQLECLELEIRLGLSSSKYTKSIYADSLDDEN